MAEYNVPVTPMGLTFVFREPENDFQFQTGLMPIGGDDPMFNGAKLSKYKCEKCNAGELVFKPSPEDTQTNFNHECTNCGHTETLEGIYPQLEFTENLDNVERFNISIVPVYKKEVPDLTDQVVIEPID